MVLDLMMPHVGGHEVLETAKVSLATAGLPTIVLTAQNDRQMEIRVLCGARTTTSASRSIPRCS